MQRCRYFIVAVALTSAINRDCLVPGIFGGNIVTALKVFHDAALAHSSLLLRHPHGTPIWTKTIHRHYLCNLRRHCHYLATETINLRLWGNSANN